MLNILKPKYFYLFFTISTCFILLTLFIVLISNGYLVIPLPFTSPNRHHSYLTAISVKEDASSKLYS